MSNNYPAWTVGNNGTGRRTWFVVRKPIADGVEVPIEDRYHTDKNGDLIRYKSHETAARAALKLNEAEGRVTRVIFRRWYKQQDGTGVIAIFPDEKETRAGLVQMYEHVGQHGAGDASGVINRTKPATPDEYRALKRELESPPYTYILKVVQRR